MDLSKKILVSQEYCTGFVDCRHTNSRASCLLFVLLATGKAGQKVGFAVYCAGDAPPCIKRNHFHLL